MEGNVLFNTLRAVGMTAQWGWRSWDEMKQNSGRRAELMGAVERQMTEGHGAGTVFIGASVDEFESTIHALQDTLETAAARIRPLFADALHRQSRSIRVMCVAIRIL